MEQSVPKRRHIKFRRRGITQKKTYNIYNTAKAWYQEMYGTLGLNSPDSNLSNLIDVIILFSQFQILYFKKASHKHLVRTSCSLH
jgi:hypothetical protein